MAMLLSQELGLPFSVTILASWQDVKEQADEEHELEFSEDRYYFEDEPYTLKEYKNFKIRFLTEGDDAAHASLRIGVKDHDEIWVLEPSEERVIYNRQDEHDFPWVPDEYLLTVEWQGKRYYSSFKIVPKHVSEAQLEQMRKTINQLIQGLAFDINYKKATGGKRQQSALLDSELLLLDLLESKTDQLIRNINEILSAPLTSLGKVYAERSDRFRLDHKAMRWLASNRGQSLNPDVSTPNVLYQKKSVTTLDNQENKWFLKVIDLVNRKLRVLEGKLNQMLQTQRGILHSLQTDQIRHERELVGLKDSHLSYSLQHEIRRRERQIGFRQNEINEVEQRVKTLQGNIQRTQRLIRQFELVKQSNLYKANQDFRKVQRPTKLMLKDRRYKRIYDLYSQILHHSHHDSGLKDTGYKFKKTEKLYEYYVLMATIAAFQADGFQWDENDWLLQQIKDQAILLDLPKGTGVTLQKGKVQAKIWYEDEVEVCSERQLRAYDRKFFTNNVSLMPDLRVDLYAEDEGLINSFIIEVKYRKYNRLYSDDHNTDVKNKMTNYISQIMYLDQVHSPGPPVRPIQKVLIVYPEDFYQREVVCEKMFGQFTFVQLSPDRNQPESHFGFAEFKQVIHELVEELTGVAVLV